MKLIIAILLCIATIKTGEFYTYKDEEMNLTPELNPHVKASSTY